MKSFQRYWPAANDFENNNARSEPQLSDQGLLRELLAVNDFEGPSLDWARRARSAPEAAEIPFLNLPKLRSIHSDEVLGHLLQRVVELQTSRDGQISELFYSNDGKEVALGIHHSICERNP